MQAPNDSSKKRNRLLLGAGVLTTIMSLFSFVVSIAAPGIGWVAAVVALLGASALTPYVGRRFAVIALLISVVHLFTFGPFYALRPPFATHALPPLPFVLMLVAAPFAAALVSIFRLKTRGSHAHPIP